MNKLELIRALKDAADLSKSEAAIFQGGERIEGAGGSVKLKS